MQVNELVEVTEGCEDGGDDHLVGERGVIISLDEEGYAEVRLHNHGKDTFQFGLYQLTAV